MSESRAIARRIRSIANHCQDLRAAIGLRVLAEEIEQSTGEDPAELRVNEDLDQARNSDRDTFSSGRLEKFARG
jgi:hypothetical protein